MKVRPAASFLDLAEAMRQVAEIHDADALLAYLTEHYEFCTPTRVNVRMRHYGKDNRIGWDTWLVTLDGHAVLFADGPLLEFLEGANDPRPEDDC